MAEGLISDDDIQRVREASDLVAIIGERSPVRQRGKDFWCCCPLHNEKTPSFKIDPATQLWHCFGCGEGGDVFGFLMKTEDLNFPEAVRKLAERAGIPLAETGGRSGGSSSRKARLKAICAASAEFFHTQLMRGKGEGASQARTYLAGRGLGGAVPKKWNLGYAPGRSELTRHLLQQGFKPAELVEANVAVEGKGGKVRDRFFDRVMFPINDAQGECIAFGGRIMGQGQPKYLNSQETPIFHKSQVFYGLDQAKAAMTATGTAIVVEGYTDVIALSEAGIENVVATLGTSLTLQHIRVLGRHAKHRVVYLFDGDEAGQRAADRALGFIDSSMTPEAGRSKIELAAVTLPDNLDPAEFVAARGADELRALVEGAQPLVQYGIERRLAAHDLSRPEGRTAALADALSVLAPIKDSLLAKDYAVQIASRTRAREEDVLAQLAALRPPRRSDEQGGADGLPAVNASAGVEAAPGGAVPAARAQAAFSQTELNRRRFEREMLCVAAQNPVVALLHADALAQTQWHEPVHARLSESLLDALADDPAAAPADIVTRAQQSVPQAASILTSGSMGEGTTPERLAAFLAEELAIGDMEDAVASLRAQMANPVSLPADEYELLFESTVAMQKDLAARRAAHRPLG